MFSGARPIRIQDPAYRYPPSSNPYWATLKGINQQVYLDNATEAHSGQWKSILAELSGRRPAELHVEIGCNGGHVVLEWAARNPDIGYLGLDWKFKQIYRGYEKAAKRGLRNLAFLRAHAVRLGLMFAPGEIDKLYLLFPDPWPKKSQKKNRLFTAEWLRSVAPLLRAGGEFEIRTDHPAYFEWMVEEAAQVSGQFSVAALSRDLYAGHPDPLKLEIPDVTLFERLFIRDGLPIHRLLLQRLP